MRFLPTLPLRRLHRHLHLSQTLAVGSVLPRQRGRPTARPGRQVGHLGLVVREAARVARFVAALAVGGSLRVAGAPEQGLHAGGLVRGHGQLLFEGQHG